MSWYLLPSGMPFNAVDGSTLAARILDEGATVLDADDVAAAITAWNNRVPGPAGHPADFVTQGALDEFEAGLHAAFVAGRVFNHDLTPSTTKKLSVVLTADGTDIEDLIIEAI